MAKKAPKTGVLKPEQEDDGIQPPLVGGDDGDDEAGDSQQPHRHDTPQLVTENTSGSRHHETSKQSGGAHDGERCRELGRAEAKTGSPCRQKDGYGRLHKQ